MTPAEIQALLEVPSHQSSTPIKVEEAEFLYQFIKEKSCKRTLETGFGFARSASHIMAASEAPHIVIDPYQSNYNYGGLKNIEKIGLREQITLIEKSSHIALPELVNENKSFDFIFIDGDHRFDGCFVDYFYADLLLAEKGYLLFHDTWMQPIQLVINFIRQNRKDYIEVPTPLPNFSMWQKIAKDGRGSMDHKGFYTSKSWLKHHLIYWLHNGKNQGLKDGLKSLKKLFSK